MIKKLLSYLLTPIYLLCFGLLLVIFHPIQMVTRWIWGYPVRKKAVDVLNFGLLYSLSDFRNKNHIQWLGKNTARASTYYCS